ncbi:phenylalanine--tRNA ligase subunit beta [soil metagenome]
MKFSEQWLREWVKVPLDTDTLLQRLTMAGHELETVEAVADSEDNIIDIDFTPNRGDCLSIMGIAREAAAVTHSIYIPITTPAILTTSPSTFPVNVQAATDCPRYIGRVIENINIHAETPAWILQRLTCSGLRSVDAVVDITNYVMLELGQPLHAFDKNILHNHIVVRRAKKNESLTLLNGQKIALEADTLVIADEHKVLALAGIMGGENSGVKTNTKSIFLESAYFNPLTIAGRALRYGLHTDSSHRFERGVDFELQNQAIERATELLLAIVGGEPGPVIEQVAPEYLPKRPPIILRKQRIERLLGIPFTTTQVEQLLTRLNFELISQEQDIWQVSIPSYRFDISREVDLIEEVARLYGYNNIPLHAPVTQVSDQDVDIRPPQSQARLRALLMSRGYQEIISYSFVEPKLQQLLDPENAAIELANPISAEMAVMRTSLWPGLLSVVSYNQNRQQPRMRLFEIGQCFIQKEKTITQDVRIAGVITGSVYPEQWGYSQRNNDFYDIKGDVESLINSVSKGKTIVYQTASHPALHPGQSCQIICNGVVAGHMGALNPQISHTIGCTGPLYLFEFILKTIDVVALPTYKSLVKFPAIRRDIALVIDSHITALQIEEIIITTAGELLREMQIFDVYQGKGIEPGKKSIALALILQNPRRTLKDEEVNIVVTRVLSALADALQAKLRE